MVFKFEVVILLILIYFYIFEIVIFSKFMMFINFNEILIEFVVMYVVYYRSVSLC